MRLPEQCGYLGKKRSGKTANMFYHEVIDELLTGRRDIVTNVRIFPELLNEWIQRRHPDVESRFVQRVRVLDRDQVQRFWRYRGRLPDGSWYDVPESNIDAKTGWIDFSGKPETPVLYAIQELHLYFNARNWVKTGMPTMFWASQFAKFGDRFAYDTQNFDQVDKQLRNLTDSYRLCQNAGRRAVLGIFRGTVGNLEWREFDHYPPRPGSFTQERGVTRLDVKGWAACYDTTSGAGIVGGESGDKGQVRKGVNLIWILPILAAVLICLFIFVPRAFGYVTQKAVTGMLAPVRSVTNRLASSLIPQAPVTASVVSNVAAVVVAPKKLRRDFVGSYVLGGVPMLLLGPNRTLRAEFVHESGLWALVNGEVWKLREVQLETASPQRLSPVAGSRLDSGTVLDGLAPVIPF